MSEDQKRSVFISIPEKGGVKNVQTAGQVLSFPMLVRLCLKSFKLGFSSMYSKNFQMYRLGLEKAEEPEIKLPTFAGSWRKQGNSRKTSASLTMLKPLTVWITTNLENSSRDENTRPPYLSPEKPVFWSRSNS